MSEPRKASERHTELEVGSAMLILPLLLILGAFALVAFYIDKQHTERMIRAGFCEVLLDPLRVTVWRPCATVPAAPRPDPTVGYGIGKP